jgi:hypothetical protein
MQENSFYFNGAEFAVEHPEELAAFFANIWSWFTGLVIPLQIAVVAGVFFLIWGIASLAYNIMKLVVWASYKVWIYIFIGIYAGIYLIVKVIGKASNHKDVKTAFSETADKLYGMVEAERNIWAFPFAQEKAKAKV